MFCAGSACAEEVTEVEGETLTDEDTAVVVLVGVWVTEVDGVEITDVVEVDEVVGAVTIDVVELIVRVEVVVDELVVVAVLFVEAPPATVI